MDITTEPPVTMQQLDHYVQTVMKPEPKIKHILKRELSHYNTKFAKKQQSI